MYSNVICHGGDLGPRPRRFLLRVFFLGFFFKKGCVLADRSHSSGSSTEWLSFASIVAAVLITPKGAKSPGSGRRGVIDALVFFPSEAV